MHFYLFYLSSNNWQDLNVTHYKKKKKKPLPLLLSLQGQKVYNKVLNASETRVRASDERA